MPRPSSAIEVYIEAGSRRAFAGAVAWPGWCRMGREEPEALDALVLYGPRYADVVRGIRPAFRAPRAAGALKVVERLRGDATTDFGAPSIAPKADTTPIDDPELKRLTAILNACWKGFDRGVEGAGGTRLRKGPRGGGRNLGDIVAHVAGAEAGYLAHVAAKSPKMNTRLARADIDRERESVLDALNRAVVEGLPDSGPRGGKIWLPRYFVRRVAWHALDHAWEIEDRSTS